MLWGYLHILKHDLPVNLIIEDARTRNASISVSNLNFQIFIKCSPTNYTITQLLCKLCSYGMVDVNLASWDLL